MKIPALVAVLALPLSVFAQTPSQPVGSEKTGTIFFRTNIGSFKFINGKGQVNISFKGSVLVSKLKGTISTTGNLRKEYDDKGRQVYFGTGTIALNGEFRAIQWFGKSLEGKWTGRGRARFVGEFDKDLKTGEFWYDTNPEKQAWGTFREVDVPDIAPARVVPRDRTKTTGGGGKR